MNRLEPAIYFPVDGELLVITFDEALELVAELRTPNPALPPHVSDASVAAAVLLERLVEDGWGTQNPDFTEAELAAILFALAGLLVTHGISVRMKRLQDALFQRAIRRDLPHPPSSSPQ